MRERERERVTFTIQRQLLEFTFTNSNIKNGKSGEKESFHTSIKLRAIESQ